MRCLWNSDCKIYILKTNKIVKQKSLEIHIYILQIDSLAFYYQQLIVVKSILALWGSAESKIEAKNANPIGKNGTPTTRVFAGQPAKFPPDYLAYADLYPIMPRNSPTNQVRNSSGSIYLLWEQCERNI